MLSSKQKPCLNIAVKQTIWESDITLSNLLLLPKVWDTVNAEIETPYR